MGSKSWPVPFEELTAKGENQLQCLLHTKWQSGSHPKRLPIRILNPNTDPRGVVAALQSLQRTILHRGHRQWLLDIDEDYFFPKFSPAVPLAEAGLRNNLESELSEALRGDALCPLLDMNAPVLQS